MALSEQTFTTTVDSNGDAVVSFKVSNGLETWTVTKVSVEMQDAPAGAVCYVRKNENLVTPIIPTADTAAGEPPVQIRPSDVFTIEWENCTPGDIGRAVIYYDDGRES